MDFDSISDIPNIGQMIEKDADSPWLLPRIKRRKPPVVQSGSGMLNAIGYAQKLLQEAPKYIEAIDQVAFGPVGTAVSNTLSEYYNKNDRWRPGFAGEKHLVLPTAAGLTRANFAGPGTRLRERLERGDEGVDGPRGIDIASKKHDIAYAAATSYNDIRRADQEFIEDVEESTAPVALKKVVKASMKAKTFGEDVGLFNKERYLTESQKKKFKGKGMKIVKDNRSGTKLSPAQLLEKAMKKKRKKSSH